MDLSSYLKPILAQEIVDRINERELTQHEAAKILKLPQPQVSKLMNGKYRGIGVLKMWQCLGQLGLDVEVVIHHPDGRSPTVAPAIKQLGNNLYRKYF